MKFVSFMVTLQEVPSEVSLSFFISGCSHHCKNCHSSFAWNKNIGDNLTEEVFLNYLNQYKNLATCVLFLGGEWYPDQLIHFLKLAKANGYKTCLYTGCDDISQDIKQNLDFLKTGEYKEDLGGLNSKITNQKFIRLSDNKDLTNIFWEE